MAELSKKARQQRNLAIGALFLIVLAVVILIDAVKKDEGAFSDDGFFGEEAKLLRICKANAKRQIARKPRIEDVYDGKIYASGLNAFGMRMPITFECNKGSAIQID